MKRPVGQRNPVRPVALVVLLACGTMTAGRAVSDDAEVTVLEPGSAVERALGAGERHVYRVEAAAGDFFRVRVDQRSTDVVLAAIGPGGEPLAEVDNENLDWIATCEQLSFVASEAGCYRFELRTGPSAPPQGLYRIRLVERRPSGPADGDRVAAERAFTQGMTAGLRRSYQEADGRFGEAVALYRKAGDRPEEARAVENQGLARMGLGQFEENLRLNQEALALYRSEGNGEKEARLLNAIANSHSRVGDHPRQLDYYEQSLTAYRALGHRAGETFQLINIGGLYLRHLGDPEQAAEAFQQAIAVSGTAGLKGQEANANYWLAEVHRRMGAHEAALERLRASAELARADGSPPQESLTESLLGKVYADLGDRERAVAHLTRALELGRASRGSNRGGTDIELNALRAFADVYEKLGDYENALLQARAAATHAGQYREMAEKIRFLVSRLELARGNLETARAEIEAVIESLELRRTLILQERVRAALLDHNQKFYELYIEILMRLHERQPQAGHDAAALRVSERMRARNLLDFLAEARVDIRKGVDTALLERERKALRDLEKASRPSVAQGGVDPAATAGEVARLTEEYQAVRAEIRRLSPRYAAVSGAHHLGLPEIQALLDGDTRLLSYVLGAERSYLWVVSASGLETHRLPGRVEVETAARRVRAALAQRPGSGTVEGAWPAAAQELSAMVLGPAVSALSARRLLVVADGALQLVPFGVLPAPGAGSREVRPLVLDHEVVSLPSATVLGVLRAENSGRAPAPKAVAVLADPVFDRHDPRVAARTVARAAGYPGSRLAARALERAVRDAGLDAGHIPRLPFTRREAAAILELAPRKGTLAALDFEAGRELATEGGLADYRIVHFASHGMVNAEHPELSGVLLSMVDRQGGSRDGFLRLADVSGLKLPADLVVLSGCQTAVGKQMRGEGLMSLTRGFMYAGATRVLSTLWKVDDRATAELMRRFYQGLLGPQRLSAAAALHAAQASMRRERRWSHPYFWAGFVLQGEWR